MKLAFFITCQIYTATCLKRLNELNLNNMFTNLQTKQTQIHDLLTSVEEYMDMQNKN